MNKLGLCQSQDTTQKNVDLLSTSCDRDLADWKKKIEVQIRFNKIWKKKILLRWVKIQIKFTGQGPGLDGFQI